MFYLRHAGLGDFIITLQKIPVLLIIFLLFSTAFLVSCSTADDAGKDNINEENNPKENQDQDKKNESKNFSEDETTKFKKELSAPEQPKTMNEVLSYPVGEYADVNYKESADGKKEMLNTFLKLPELQDASDKEKVKAYWNKTLSLTYAKYPDVEGVKEKIKSASYGSPQIDDPRYEFKDNLNVEIMLDASGSMGAYIGEKTMMQIAKESIHDFMKQMPKDANVSFRVYGHKGTGDKKDKEKSCAAIEQVYGYAPYDEKKFQKELDQIEPAGWTPLADVLEQAKDSLQEIDDGNSTNIVYVVSDGVETCDGDPVKVAKSFSESNITPIVNIIGFDVDKEGEKQLKDVADAVDGTYTLAKSESELQGELKRAEEIAAQWRAWKDDALTDVVYEHSKNRTEISGYHSDFFHSYLDQSKNIEGVLKDLKEEGHISNDVYRSLNEKRKDWYDMMGDLNDETKQALYEMDEEIIESLQEEIKDEADQNEK